MRTYDIFRRGENGLAPLWAKGEDNLEVAKLEAMRVSARNRADYMVLDLSNATKVLYDTREQTRSRKLQG